MQRKLSHYFALFCFTLVLCVSVKAQSDLIIYNDSLQNGWVNWSWATTNLNNPNPARAAASVSVNAAAWQAVYFHGASTGGTYNSVNFWIHGGTTGGQQLQAQATVGGAALTAVPLPNIAANSWQQINLTYTQLGVAPGASIDGFWIQDRTGSPQPVFYVDDVKLIGGTPPPPTAVAIQVNTTQNRRAINPQIYGVNYATTAQIQDLNIPLNRLGGNNTSRYNWQQNADNRGNDWYFQSIGFDNVAGKVGDDFIQSTKAGGAEPMMTVPIIDWIAKVGANREKLASFKISAYGAQTGNDAQWFPDAGNGICAAGNNSQFCPGGANSLMVGNNPNDANVPNSVDLQRGWIQHLVGRWGTASGNGLRYYILDNEYSLWQSTHRDVQPTGARMNEVFTRMRDYAAMIKSVDAGAKIVGPEEWGWAGYLYSGYDQQWGARNGWSNLPDRAANGGMDYVPWLLQKFRQDEQTRGTRLLDIFTLHYYPQGGEFSDDVSQAMQLRRNRSTRSLWDPNYVDESWIGTQVRLVPRMKEWVAQYYPNTPIGLTEYSWGADNHINGATAQADVLGILGREGMDMATRWVVPETNTPTYNAIKIYRNYNGQRAAFGETSVAASAPNPDEVSAFAAERSADGALTVMVINKVTVSKQVTVNLTGFTGAGTAQVWQLTSANQISRLSDASVNNNAVSATVPAQSITLFVIAGANAGGLNAPSSLAGNGMRRTASLTWQDNSNNEDGFVVERATSVDPQNFRVVGRVAANQTRFQIQTKTGSYLFRVRATLGTANSTPSNTLSLQVR